MGTIALTQTVDVMRDRLHCHDGRGAPMQCRDSLQTHTEEALIHQTTAITHVYHVNARFDP